ncbi:MAG TPA: hypothetical protein VIK86_00230 [Candidatus Paceibacterota bacterium]
MKDIKIIKENLPTCNLSDDEIYKHILELKETLPKNTYIVI